MALTTLNIQRLVDDIGKKQFSTLRLKVAAKAMADAEIDLIRRRTNKGLDADYTTFEPYSAKYAKEKKEIIKRGYKRYKGRGKKKRLVSIGPTAFAAEKVRDFMRLSGKMFTSMYAKKYSVKFTKYGPQVEYQLGFKGSRNQKVAGYNIDSGRNFFGPAKGRADVAFLRREFIKALNR